MRFACQKFSKTGASRFFVPTTDLTLQLENKLSRNDERPWSSVRLLRPSTSPHPTPSSSSSWWSQQKTPRSLYANSPGVFRPSNDINRRSPVHLSLPHPAPSPLGVSHALRGLLLLRPGSLVSCYRRPWDFRLQSFPLSNGQRPSPVPLPTWRYTTLPSFDLVPANRASFEHRAARSTRR